MVAKDSAELHFQVFQGGRHRGQVGGLQISSLQPQESFIRHLTGGHPGYEALLQPLLDTTSRPEQLLYKQCQLALTAPKVSSVLSEASSV